MDSRYETNASYRQTSHDIFNMYFRDKSMKFFIIYLFEKREETNGKPNLH